MDTEATLRRPRDAAPAPAPGAVEAPVDPAAPARPTRRAFGYGILGVTLLCVLTPSTDLVLRGSWIAHNCLPIGVLCLFLLLVTVGNRLLRRLSERWALARGELLLVYTMMLTAAGIPSVGLTQTVIASVVAPAYYAGVRGEWPSRLHPLVPVWLRVTDEEAVRGFFNGSPGGVPWGAWVVPLAAWTLHALLLYTAFFFLVVLLRRPWVEHERLAFPLVQVPLEIVGRDRVPTGSREFFRSPWTWAGIALPVLIHSINALHTFFPTLPPALSSPYRIGEGLVERPWSVLSNVRVYVLFSAIGLAYLLAGDVSLSLWIFWVFSRAQLLLFAAYGLEGGGSASDIGFTPSWFVSNQMWGALLAYGVFLVWDGYRTASRDWRGRRRSDGERGISPSGALAGFGVCVLLLTGWHIAAGGTLWIQLPALLLWIAAMLALTRLVCAGGLILIDTNWLPRNILFRVLGHTSIRPGDLAALTFHNTVFAWYPQLNMLPFMFNGMKVMDDARYRNRAVGWAMALAILVAIPLSFAVTLSLAYARGALTLSEHRLGAMARGRLDELVAYTQTALDPQWHTLLSLALGGAAMLGMVALKRGVDWWPLSPLGYLVGSSTTVMDRLWFPIFLGWTANALVRRYGGLREYMRFRPFFLGLILGEFAVAAFWMAVDAAAGITGRSVFPGG